MKTPAVLLWFLATLLLCGLTGWEAYRKGKESLGREQMMDIIEDNRAAMQEVRHAYTDFSVVINVIRILDQQRITEGEQRREEMQKPCRATRVPALILPLLLLSGCSNTPHTLKTRLVYEPVPTVLTRQTPVPALEIPVTWYRVTEWSDRLLEALDMQRRQGCDRTAG